MGVFMSWLRSRNGIVDLLFLSIVGFYVFWVSYEQAVYTYSPHHWGLMFSNVVDLDNGFLPYKDIFIQYGLLTTLFQWVAYLLLGGHILSIGIATAAIYVASLVLIYAISLKILADRLYAIIVTCIFVSFHSVVLYPWANYISFFFILLAIFVLFSEVSSKFFLFGFFLSLAILSREGQALPILVFLIYWSLLNMLLKKNIREVVVAIIGFLLPIAIFMVYLFDSGIFSYWQISSLSLPKVYIANSFPHMGSIASALAEFTRNLFDQISLINTRFLLLLFLLLIGTFVSLLWLPRIREERFYRLNIVLAISFLSLASALHLTEPFRVATGLLFLTIPVVFYFYNKRRCAVAMVTFFVSSLIFLDKDPHNYFHVSANEVLLQHGEAIHPMFSGKIWPVERTQYYDSVQADLRQIDDYDCDIKYHYNGTWDAYLHVLSPFEKYQVAPFSTADSVNNLRKDLDYRAKIEDANDMILFMFADINDYKNYVPFKGYRVFSEHTFQNFYFEAVPGYLLILVPENCV